MDPFITRYLADVNDQLGAPATSARLTTARKLLDLYTVECQVWEELLRCSGSESVLGRTEIQLTLRDGVGDYPLPGNFRQFISFQRYASSTEDLLSFEGADWQQSAKLIYLVGGFAEYVYAPGDEVVITAPEAAAGTYAISGNGTRTDCNDKLETGTDIYDGNLTGEVAGTIRRTVYDRSTPLDYRLSIAEEGVGPGILIKDQRRGMQIRPVPVLSADETWVLAYQRGPLLLHFGSGYLRANLMRNDTSGMVTTNAQGEAVFSRNYYQGALLHLYGSTVLGQTRVIKHFDPVAQKFELEETFSPIPDGGYGYEILPTLPWPYDAIYALKVAMWRAPRRRDPLYRTMQRQHDQLWSACVAYAISNTRDRAPTRNRPVRRYQQDPYDGVIS